MANDDFTQVADDEAEDIGFGAYSQVYQLRPDVGELDLVDELDAKLTHLRAMLQQTYGGSGESFRNYNNHIQDNYMWACATLADECQVLLAGLSELRRASKKEHVTS